MNNQVVKSGEQGVAMEFVKTVRGYLSDVSRSFFKIGYELHKAQAGKHYQALGYDSLEELAEDAFGFSKSTMYDMLKVYEACRLWGSPAEMKEVCAPYSFSQLAAMQSGYYASPETLISHGFVKPTDSVRAIKKYVSFFNKYTDKHSDYPGVTLQEWLAQEEKRQAELESSEQLQLGELVEEEAEAQGEKFQTSGLQELADAETAPEEIEEIEEETDETENVSCETETPKYSFENRDKIRAFYGDYKNWGCYISFAEWQKCYRYDFRNGMSVFAVESTSCKDIENMTPCEKKVRYFWRDKGYTYEVSVLDMERYIATIKDEL